MSKTRAFIWGSCVTRDTFEFFPQDEFELVQYVARQSAVSAYSKSVTLIEPPAFDSGFRQRTILGDFMSNLRTELRRAGNDVDLLLVDLVDERLGIYVLPDGSVITRSVELIESGIEGSLPPGTRHIPFGNSEHFQYWRVGMEAIGALIREVMPRAAIALFDVPWAEATVAGEPSSASFGISAAEANMMFPAYARAAQKVLDARVIRPRVKSIRSSASHPWGEAPFHYAPDVYSDLATQVAGRSVDPVAAADAHATDADAPAPAHQTEAHATRALDLKARVAANQIAAINARLPLKLSGAWHKHWVSTDPAESVHEFYDGKDLFSFSIMAGEDLCEVALVAARPASFEGILHRLAEKGRRPLDVDGRNLRTTIFSEAIPMGVASASFTDHLAAAVNAWRKDAVAARVLPIGYVDGISQGRTVVSGWVQLDLDGAAPQVVARLGSETITEVTYGGLRRDVLERLGVENARFMVKLPFALANPRLEDGSFAIEANGLPLEVAETLLAQQ